MRTALDVRAMQIASSISSSRRFKNPHVVGTWGWHWHKRVIGEVASHIANMSCTNSRIVEKAKIFGALQSLEDRLFQRVSEPRQKV